MHTYYVAVADWNDWLYQWIGYDNWTYVGTMDVSEQEMSVGLIWLKFDGLDTIARVRYAGLVRLLCSALILFMIMLFSSFIFTVQATVYNIQRQNKCKFF